MIDALTADLLACVEDKHEGIGYERDPVKVCELLDIAYLRGPTGLARIGKRGGPDLIFVPEGQFGSRDLFTVAHEIAHVIARREGYVRLIRRRHQVQDMRRHIELIINEAGSRLLMPMPDLYSAVRTYGDTPRAVQHLSDLSGASLAAARRRWTRQDFTERRAAFEIDQGYVHDVTTWGARLPFRRGDRVPEVALEHPELMLLGLGDGRVMGTIACTVGC